MPRLCCGCCLSRRRCKSFPIHEKQRETEVNKICIRHVESIRLTPPPLPLTINRQQDKKTKSKATTKNKSNDTHSRTSLEKIFPKSKQTKTPSPLPTPIGDIPEENHDKIIVNTSPSWSLSTNSQHKKSSKHRSCVDSYERSKDNTSQHKKTSNDIKPSAKSKLVLENVKKMINDQNIQQQQHYNHTRQKESARL